MAMFPNAARGYMPFVSGHHRPAAKRGPKESRKKGSTKAYRVTLKDRQGFTYTYIIQGDGTKSLPTLCGSKVTMNGTSVSLPDIDKFLANQTTARKPGVDSGKKQGLFSTILKFLSNKTKSKSKRKPKPLPQRKRQRTISNISNLDPIQESPDEYEDESDCDDDEECSSYTHDEESETEDVAVESIHENINTLILTPQP